MKEELEEGKGTQKSNPTLEDADAVEKDEAAIGHWWVTDLDGEEAEKLVHEVLANCPGLEGAYATNATSTVVMAKFNTPGMAMNTVPAHEGEQVVGFRKSFANRTPAVQTCQQIEKIAF